MSFGKMREFIDIIDIQYSTDKDGFQVREEIPVASVRAYVEKRNGSEKWANRAAFSQSDWLFVFRAVPGIDVAASLRVRYKGELFDITSVEDVRGRGMYWEVLATMIDESEGGG